MVVSGFIGSQDEADALAVRLSIRDSEITMRSDGTELGSWPAAAVEIRRIDSTAFEFIAEGDRLIFTPDDPATFANTPIVGGQDAGAGGRKRRRSKKKLHRSGPGLARDQALSDEGRGSRRRASEEPSKVKPSKPSFPRHAPTGETAGSEAARLSGVPAPPADVPGAIDAASDDDQREPEAASFGDRRPRTSQHELPAGVPAPEDTPAPESKKKGKGVWIRALDVARKYDTFGLDRVPIDENLRGQEHQHTWDHRVAATSGLGKHICTICGAIRR